MCRLDSVYAFPNPRSSQSQMNFLNTRVVSKWTFSSLDAPITSSTSVNSKMQIEAEPLTSDFYSTRE